MPSCADQTKEGDPVQADSARYPVTICHSLLRLSIGATSRPAIDPALAGRVSIHGRHGHIKLEMARDSRHVSAFTYLEPLMRQGRPGH
jgi:hypothetical protein